MQAVRTVMLALCCAASAAAQEMPSLELVREVELRRDGALHGTQHAVEESRRAIAVLRVYAATGEERDFQEALRRALHLAALDPRDSIAEDSRSISWALALAYDWLSPRLDGTHKNALLEPLRTRVAQLVEQVAPENRPALTAIARMLADDAPEARRWLDELREAS